MPIYEVEKNGVTYEVDAPSLQAAAAALSRMKPDAPKAAPKGDTLGRLLGLLPAAGGTVGGIVGGIGGTAFGLGIGGVPGAMGGAALGGGAGEALRQLADFARGKASPSSSTEAAKQIAVQGGIQAAAEAVGGAVTKGAAKGARAVYRGYLKPSLAAKNLPKAREVVETALEQGLPISRSGAGIDAGGKISGKAGQIVTEMRQEVDRILASTPGKVDLADVANKVRAFARRKYYKPGADMSDFDAAMNVADRIDRHPSLGLPPGTKPKRVSVSATNANEIKRGMQAGASNSFGVPNAAAKADAEKMASHHMRKAVERVSGGPKGRVAQLNASEAKLLTTAKAIAQAVEREANQNPLIGAKSMVSGAVGSGTLAAGAGAPLAAAGALALRVGLHPAVASRAAIVADRLSKQLGVGSAAAARLAVAALSDEGE